MSNRKHILTALTLLGAALFAAPAMATPIPVTVTDVEVNWNQGQGTSTSMGDIYYAGPISFTLAGGQTIITWCDDLNNAVIIGGSYQYYQLDSAGANAYLLNPALSASDQTTLDKQIAGLAYKGTLLSQKGTLSTSQGGQIQLAIWELMNPGLMDTNPNFQNGVTNFINQALSDYDLMVKAGYTYGQLESPCDRSQAGLITYATSCQVQGQIFVTPGTLPPVSVPEPVSLSLLGAGLAGTIAARRRRKPAQAA